MTHIEQGIQRVLADLGIINQDDAIHIQRTHAGRHQRADGAWSWWAERKPGEEVAGSPHTCGEIIKAHRRGKVVVAATMTSPELYVED